MQYLKKVPQTVDSLIKLEMPNIQVEPMLKYNNRFNLLLISAAILLLIPIVFMPFVKSVQWDFLDFGILGVLLFGTAIITELVLRLVKKTTYRLVILAVLLTLFLLTWTELAVGLFGTTFASN